MSWFCPTKSVNYTPSGSRIFQSTSSSHSKLVNSIQNSFLSTLQTPAHAFFFQPVHTGRQTQILAFDNNSTSRSILYRVPVLWYQKLLWYFTVKHYGKNTYLGTIQACILIVELLGTLNIIIPILICKRTVHLWNSKHNDYRIVLLQEESCRNNILQHKFWRQIFSKYQVIF